MQKVLISDSHIGTTMWQRSMIEAAGIPVLATSLSSHLNYAPPGTVVRKTLLKYIHLLPKPLIDLAISLDSDLRDVTHALCSFPPSRFRALQNLPERIAILINIGHRIHINVKPVDLVQYNRDFEQLSSHNRFRLAAMSEYDFHYTRYYTGLNKITRLPVVTNHVPAQLRGRDYSPMNRLILIGPSHNDRRLIGFADLQDLNVRSRAFAKQNGFAPYEFDFIKTAYPRGTATPENLARHPAVLIIPYSAFSISMIELYQLNIPFFVPDDLLLCDRMADVRLCPLYQREDDVHLLDRTFASRGRELGYPFSPNDPSLEAQLFWLKKMYFNQVDNAIRFSGADDLFFKLYRTDLAEVSSRMKAENAFLFRTQETAWREFIGIQ